MQRIIAIILALILGTGFRGCQNASGPVDVEDSSTDYYVESPKVDTMYPDAVISNGKNYVTVEQAQADLLAKGGDECLEVGFITFDKLTWDWDEEEYIYWFDVSVYYELGYERYRAQACYRLDSNEEWVFVDIHTDVWQIDSVFTQMGSWEYDDGNTRIYINFIEMDGNAYVVEYEITYYASYWNGGRWVDCSSNGEVKVYGNNEWDGNCYYLSIDLGEYENEAGQEMDRGRIKVYPWYGVYWTALHSGGSYQLSQ